MAKDFFKVRNGVNLGSQTSDPSPANAGDMYFNSTSNKFRNYDGTTWSDVGSGSGGGSNPPNYGISGSSGAFSTSSTSYVDVTNLSVTITTSGSPVSLELVSDGSGNDANIYAYSTTGDTAQAAFAFIEDSTLISSQLIYPSIQGSTSPLIGVPASSLKHFYAPVAGTYTYKVQIKKIVGTGSPASVNYSRLVVQEVQIGTVTNFSNATDWTSYTPTFTGFGSPSNINMQWRREGPDCLIQGYWQNGTLGSTQASVTMPVVNSLPLQVKASFRNASKIRQNFGVWYQWPGSTAYIYNNDGFAGIGANQPSNDNQVLLAARTGSDEFFNDNSGTWTSSNNWIYVNFKVPIEGWNAIDGVVTSDTKIEYASNSGMGDSNDTTSFVNGPNGSLIPTVTYSTSRSKRVRFENPIQPTDTVQLQIQGQYGAWVTLAGDMHDSTSTSLIKGYNGDVGYGAGMYVQVNSTDYDVIFGQYQEPASSNWSGSNTSRWRVAKFSNSYPAVAGVPKVIFNEMAGYSNGTGNGRFIQTNDSKVTLTPGFYKIYGNGWFDTIANAANIMSETTFWWRTADGANSLSDPGALSLSPNCTITAGRDYNYYAWSFTNADNTSFNLYQYFQLQSNVLFVQVNTTMDIWLVPTVSSNNITNARVKMQIFAEKWS